MAAPLSADRLVEVLRAEGLEVHEYRSWRAHNRNHKGAWGPINGVMIHHTVTRGTAASVRLCYEGYASLPGPLCHGVIAKDGSVHLVGNGRANHAGLGDDEVLADVINERPLSLDNEANVDGNARFYGFECINMGDGEDPWPEIQVEAMARAAAAICRTYDWNERSVLGHLEWQPGKIDPRGPIGSRSGAYLTMGHIRDRVDDLLDTEPGDAPMPEVGGEAPQGGSSGPVDDGHPPRYQVTIDGRTYGYGAEGPHVEAVDRQLVRHGCDRHHDGDGYQPGPRWTDYTTENYADWQESLGYEGAAADGVPGEDSLGRLLEDEARVPPFPGRGAFRLGHRHPAVEQLDRQLIRRGFTRHHDGNGYQLGPRFTVHTRANVADLQRSDSRLAGDADGYPGPLTWQVAHE